MSPARFATWLAEQAESEDSDYDTRETIKTLLVRFCQSPEFKGEWETYEVPLLSEGAVSDV